MALTFPLAPADGATHTVGSTTWTYVAATDTWTGNTGGLSLPAGTASGDTLIWSGSAWIPSNDLVHDANMAVTNDF